MRVNPLVKRARVRACVRARAGAGAGAGACGCVHACVLYNVRCQLAILYDQYFVNIGITGLIY